MKGNNINCVSIWIDENFNVGDKIPDLHCMARCTGYSRTAVRESSRYLQAKGVLEINHGKSTVYAEDIFSTEEHF